jgi:sodium/proline symporter
MSAQASDMSGVAHDGACRARPSCWPRTTALRKPSGRRPGLPPGTYLNWLILAKRLRKYSECSNNSITIPTYLENRFRDKSHLDPYFLRRFIIIFS